jgi:hypothetical protein
VFRPSLLLPCGSGVSAASCSRRTCAAEDVRTSQTHAQTPMLGELAPTKLTTNSPARGAHIHGTQSAYARLPVGFSPLANMLRVGALCSVFAARRRASRCSPATCLARGVNGCVLGRAHLSFPNDRRPQPRRSVGTTGMEVIAVRQSKLIAVSSVNQFSLWQFHGVFSFPVRAAYHCGC